MSDAAAEAAPDITPAAAVPVALYRIELGFPAGVVPRWTGLGAVSGGRRHARPTRILWYDSPTAELARHQLALEEQDGLWRLVALRPGKHVWPPLSPPPIVAEAAVREQLGLADDLVAAPIASFSGEVRSWDISVASEQVAVRWIYGQLRAVVDALPVARIELTGPRQAVTSLALALAGQGAFVPLASLAAHAIALAEHNHPLARHKGSAQVPEGSNVADGLAFAIGQLVDAALYWASLIPAAPGSEPVHQMRVAVRRLRSLLGAVRKNAVGPLWLETKAELGDLARKLGEAREWDVFVEGVGAEMAAIWPQDKRVAALLTRAHKRRDAAYVTLRAGLAASETRILAVKLALFAHLRPWVDGASEFWTADCREFAADALDRQLRKLRDAGDDLAALAAVELHEVRKKAKRLRYACELFADFWGGKGVRKYLERLSALQEALGEVNDAACLEALLATLGPNGFAAGAAVGMAAQRAQPARNEAESAWRKLGNAEEFWR